MQYSEPSVPVDGRPVVLIADDEEAVRTALARNLARLGCRVVAASDGEQALHAALETRPAVVFLDLEMPFIDGHALLRQLPASGVRASIVVLSGKGNMDDVIDALRLGAVDFLRKPWSTSELASALERGIDAFRAGAEQTSVRSARPADLAGGAAGGRPARLDPLRERLLARQLALDVALPRAPRTFIHLHRAARDLDATSGGSGNSVSAEEIVHLLEPEPRLATAVLRMANSRFYPGDDETDYLSTAVARLGARMVHTVVETFALRDGYPIRAPELRQLHERIWRFSVARGLAMRALAEVTGPDVALDPVRCYLGGLLMDAGAVFLLWTLDESRRGPGEADTVPAAATELLASFHPAFGQAVLARWGMPADLVALARDHHLPAAPAPPSPMWAASLLARHLAARLVGFDDPSSPTGPRAELLDRCAYNLGVGDTVLRRLSATLSEDARATWEIYQ